MKQLTQTLDDATFASAEPQAKKVDKPLTTMVQDWLKRFSAGPESEFDRLLREEEGLREQFMQSGRQFSAGDRFTRDELYDRHALR